MKVIEDMVKRKDSEAKRKDSEATIKDRGSHSNKDRGGHSNRLEENGSVVDTQGEALSR